MHSKDLETTNINGKGKGSSSKALMSFVRKETKGSSTKRHVKVVISFDEEYNKEDGVMKIDNEERVSYTKT